MATKKGSKKAARSKKASGKTKGLSTNPASVRARAWRKRKAAERKAALASNIATVATASTAPVVRRPRKAKVAQAAPKPAAPQYLYEVTSRTGRMRVVAGSAGEAESKAQPKLADFEQFVQQSGIQFTVPLADIKPAAARAKFEEWASARRPHNVALCDNGQPLTT